MKIKYSIGDKFFGKLILDESMSKGEVYNGWEDEKIYEIEFFSVEPKKFSHGREREPMGTIDYKIDYRERGIVYTLSYNIFNFSSDEYGIENNEKHFIKKYYKQVTQEELDYLIESNNFRNL